MPTYTYLGNGPSNRKKTFFRISKGIGPALPVQHFQCKSRTFFLESAHFLSKKCEVHFALFFLNFCNFSILWYIFLHMFSIFLFPNCTILQCRNGCNFWLKQYILSKDKREMANLRLFVPHSRFDWTQWKALQPIYSKLQNLYIRVNQYVDFKKKD